MKIPFTALVSFVVLFGTTNYGVSAFTSCPSVLRQSPLVVPSYCNSQGKVTAVTSRTFGIASSSRKRNKERSRLFAIDDEDDEDDGPLGKGIDSVSWLPSVYKAKNVQNPMIRKDSEILPLFPLGGIVYTPNSEHILNIFEPRYRQMYTDILMNGTKRFVVAMSHPQEKGSFAQMGVLFELEDLKEVSELTNDQIKYICNHKVTGRVKLHRILNPTDWESRSTYLKVEGTIIDDTKTEDEEPAVIRDVYTAFASAMGSVQESKAEKDLKASFADLVEIQHELEEDVRFTKASVSVLSVKSGPGEDGLWQTIRLWQAYADQRLVARQNELQKDFQAKLQDFLKKEKGMKENELPSSISFQELSEELQREVQKLQKRMAIDLEPLILESTLTMQKILEAENHEARCDLLRYFIDAERKRLNAKKTLRGMFATTNTLSPDSSQSTTNQESPSSSSSSLSSSSSSSPPSDGPSSSLPTFPSSSETQSIYDQPDAFQ